ncbi:hypothetical protein VP468E531_P0081 [Vibrio phage 468E53-1]|nr:hypothetical protein VP468E531_P0081 [Vibrio phage 468E53-1]
MGYILLYSGITGKNPRFVTQLIVISWLVGYIRLSILMGQWCWLCGV